jgi:hypothetical protein
MNDREEATRRLSASAPTPEQPSSFFDGLGLLASQSTPTPVPPRGRRLLRLAAVAMGGALVMSSAAYAGALGTPAQERVRHLLGHRTAGHHLVDRTPAPTEQVAPVVVLKLKHEEADDPADPEDETTQPHHAATPPPAVAVDPGDTDEPDTEPDTEPADDPGDDNQGEDPGDDNQGPGEDDQGEEDQGDDNQAEDPGDDNQGEDPGDDSEGEDPGDDGQGDDTADESEHADDGDGPGTHDHSDGQQ